MQSILGYFSKGRVLGCIWAMSGASLSHVLQLARGRRVVTVVKLVIAPITMLILSVGFLVSASWNRSYY